MGNGTLAPLFLVTRKPYVDDFNLKETRVELIEKTKEKSKERRGEESMLAFLEYQKSQNTFSPGDVLISDNESSFDTKLVLAFLNDMGVEKLNFPPGFGHLCDPCDNNFHSEEKKRYYNIIAGLNISELSFQTKCESIHSAYFNGKEDSIINYFLRCGILGNQEPSEIANKLLGEGYYPSPKFDAFHEQQRSAYNNWKLEPDSEEESSFSL